MFKKDYIQRQFEEFGKVMAVILGFKKNKDWALFEFEIDKAMSTFTPFEIKDIIEKNEESFKLLIGESGHLKSDQIKILADLLYERSFISDKNDEDEERIGLLKKAYFLYDLFSNSLTANDYNVEVRYRLDLIKKILNANTRH